MLEQTQWLNEAVIGTRGTRAALQSERRRPRLPRQRLRHAERRALRALLRDDFASYRLVVDGEVERSRRSRSPSCGRCRSLSQITRHDCVEGWSAIGEWSGVPLGRFLALVRPAPRRALRHLPLLWTATPDGTPYYESLNLHQAAHPQTLLALDLNGKPLDPDHGAPVRLRIPTQLGYKSAKWVNRIELAGELRSHSSAARAATGKINGYEWYAGI